MELKDHCFLITGAASGLGAACTRRFIQAGAAVLVADLDRTGGEKLPYELGQRCAFCETDVTSAISVEKALDMAQDQFGLVRGVIQCAGILGAASVLSRDGPCDLASFERVLQVNLVGTFNVLRLAAARMRQNELDEGGERGVLVQTSSVAAFEGQLGQAAYAASKGGVAAMTLPLARELARYAIRVVAIAPGLFATPMVANLPAVIQQSLRDQTVYPQRFGEPDEFAALAQHVVENRMLNGATLRLDGAVRLSAR